MPHTRPNPAMPSTAFAVPESTRARVLASCIVAAMLACGICNIARAQSAGTATTGQEPARNTPRTTPSGHRYLLPRDWTQTTRDHVVVLEAPEGGSWIALAEVDATNATDAIAQAWMRYAGHQPPERTLSMPVANRDGWVDGWSHVYRTPPGEPRQWMARSMRNGNRWVVRIDDIANSLAARRSADLRLIRDEFLPAGHVRESFAGRRAHALDAAKLDALTSFVRRSQALLDVPGISIGIVQKGQVVFAGGFGVRETGHQDAVDADTLYLIASNTKPLTTLMLAKLVDEGRLRWETPVVDLFPGFRLADAEITRKVEVRHLACACAGLPYRNLDWEFAPADSPASIAFDTLARMRPTSAFGASYQYSNPPAAAAGLVGGHVAYPDLEPGEAYDRAMATRVFEPLGMSRTTFDFDRAMRGNFARSHGTDLEGDLVRVDPRRDRQMNAMRPAGGAWSNINDLLAYLKLELSGGLLDDGRRHIAESALRHRWTSQIGTGPRSWYGLGLDTDISSGTPMLFHGGRLYGQRSNIVWWPEHDVGVVILTNASTGNVLMDAFPRKVMELLFDGQPEADSMVAAAGDRQQRDARRSTWNAIIDSGHAALLAPRYRNALLGELRVMQSPGSVRFVFDAWDMPMASRINAAGAVEFAGTIPSPPPPWVAGDSRSGRTLTLRDAQNEYVFTEMK